MGEDKASDDCPSMSTASPAPCMRNVLEKEVPISGSALSWLRREFENRISSIFGEESIIVVSRRGS